MKAGYTVYCSVNYELDKVIEVSNDFFCNEVIHYGWYSINSYEMGKDENTLGVWKVKYKN